MAENEKRPSCRVAITEAHIAKGRRHELTKCPLYLALRDAGFREIKVDRRAVYVEIDGRGYIAPLPIDARVFVDEFDRGLTCKPMSFDFDYTREV